jgi:acyl carrier protein
MIQDAELLGFFEDRYREVRGSRRDVGPDDHLYDDLGIDSLLATELLIALEDRYDLHLLHDPRVWKVVMVGELLKLVQALAGEQRAADPVAA